MTICEKTFEKFVKYVLQFEVFAVPSFRVLMIDHNAINT
jgi:hypothetical protein